MSFAGLDGSDLVDIFNANSLEYFVGPTLSWDILNFGRIKSRVRLQDAKFQALVAQYREVVLKAAKEAEDAIAGFLKSRLEEDKRVESCKASERSVKLSLFQYTEGLVDYQRVLDSQRSYLAAESALVQTKGSVAFNLIDLYKALGGGWQTRTEADLVSQEIKNEMAKRTDWGDLLQPGEMDLSAEEKKELWRGADW